MPPPKNKTKTENSIFKNGERVKTIRNDVWFITTIRKLQELNKYKICVEKLKN